MGALQGRKTLRIVGVAAQMLAENVHPSKPLGAARHSARVRLLARVAAKMHDELHLGAKGLAAPRTIAPMAAARRRITVAHAANVHIEHVPPELRHIIKSAPAFYPMTDGIRVILLLLGRRRRARRHRRRAAGGRGRQSPPHHGGRRRGRTGRRRGEGRHFWNPIRRTRGSDSEMPKTRVLDKSRCLKRAKGLMRPPRRLL